MPHNISKLYKHENSLSKLFGLGILLPLFGSALSVTALHGWRMEQIVGHAFLEALGGITALLVVTLIYANQASTQLKQSEISWIATALLSMGVLDFFHAIVPPGNNFVWLHSTATMVGGVFFGGIWLSNILQNKTKLLPLVACILSIFLVTWSLQMPNDVPRMLSSDGAFSLLARLLNIGGGLGFIAGCLYLYKRYQKTNRKDYFLLAVHCLLFGMAGILFEISELWDASWWWWHVLRFGAYVVLAIFFIRGVLEKIITNTERKLFFFPKHILAGATLLTILAFGWIAHTVYLKSEVLQKIQEVSLPAIELTGRIAHIDEILTTSAYMATMTGELEWEERYNANVKELDLAIKKAIALVPEVSFGQSAEQTNTAHQKLVEVEIQVFDLINKQKTEEAKSVIFSNAYKEQKKLYSNGMEIFYEKLQESTNADIEDSIRFSETIEVIISVVLLMLISVWAIVFLNIRATQMALQNSEAKNKAIVDNTVDGFITIDDKGLIETFNNASERIFGYRIDEVIGKNIKMLMPALYHDEHDGYLHNDHMTGNKQILGKDREVEGRRKDGSVFPMDLSISEVGIKGQELYSAIVRDITERKQAKDSLILANTELEEFAYRTSHDLRSPLVSSIGLLNITEESIRSNNNDMAFESLAHAQKSLQTLEKLVTDILLLTRIKNEEEDETVIDLEFLIASSLDKFKHMDHFERLDVQQDFRFSNTFSTKKSRFTLIVENMISNVIKYQDLEKDNPFIKISTYKEANNFVMEVHDNGLGVPKNQQDNLFKMFKRFHPKTSFGSGLGLYMMKKSAGILGGQIYFEDPGDGSVFKLKIPLTE